MVARSFRNWSFFTAFILLFPPVRGSGQVLQTDVIASFQRSDTAARLIGTVQLGFSLQQQLNTVFELQGGTDMQYNIGTDALVLATKAKRTYAGDVQVTNSGYGHLRYLFRRKERFGFDGFTQYQWDGPRGMRSRFLFGANVRLGLWRDSVSSLDAAAGLMYEREEWDYSGVEMSRRPADPPNVRVDHPRINTYLRYYRALTPLLEVLLMNYVQTRTGGHFTDPRIATAVQVGVKVSDNFAFTINYNSIYDTAPVVPIRNFYFDISNNLTYRF